MLYWILELDRETVVPDFCVQDILDRPFGGAVVPNIM